MLTRMLATPPKTACLLASSVYLTPSSRMRQVDLPSFRSNRAYVERKGKSLDSNLAVGTLYDFAPLAT